MRLEARLAGTRVVPTRPLSCHDELAHGVAPDRGEARDDGGQNTAGQQKGPRAGNAQCLHVDQEILVKLPSDGHRNGESVNRHVCPVAGAGGSREPGQLGQLVHVAPVQIRLGAETHIEEDDADSPAGDGRQRGGRGVRIVESAADVN